MLPLLTQLFDRHTYTSSEFTVQSIFCPKNESQSLSKSILPTFLDFLTQKLSMYC